ncbi:MAG: hypothetical protein J5985_06820 [Kiritimatiellae bacterium]|nr:hypothetical protein [Kiritimatiellia bacterium]
MSEGKFSALLSVIVPPVVELIAERKGISETTATESFYRSAVYARLSDETSKLWHYSAETLYAMYDDEISGRAIEFPEEAF